MINLDFGVIRDSLPYLWQGMQYTLQLTAIVGDRRPVLRHAARDGAALEHQAAGVVRVGRYVNLMRSIPLVLVIFWFFFLVPLIAQAIIGAERPLQIGAERTAIHHVHHVRGRVLLRDHARGHPVDPARAGAFRVCARD